MYKTWNIEVVGADKNAVAQEAMELLSGKARAESTENRHKVQTLMTVVYSAIMRVTVRDGYKLKVTVSSDENGGVNLNTKLVAVE